MERTGTGAWAPWAARVGLPEALIALNIGLYLVAFSWLSIARHWTYNSTGLDLAVYDQAIWNTAHGQPFESSVEVNNLLGDHADLILLLYVPLYWAWPDVRGLLLLKTAILAAGAVPVALLARRRLGSRWLACGWAVAYLLYPSLGFINRFDFHPEVIVLPAGLFAWFFIDARNWRMTALCLVLILLSKEYMGLMVAGYGAYMLLTTDSAPMRRLGLAALLIGPLWTLAMVLWLIPTVGGGLPANFTERYLWFLGHNVPDRLRLVFLLFLKVVFLPEMLAPVVFLPLLAPARLVPLLPPLLIAWASSAPSQTTLYFHYMAEFMPTLFASTIYAAERVMNRTRDRVGTRWPEQAGALLCVSALLATAGYWAARNPFNHEVPPAYYAVAGPQHRENAEAIATALALIPEDGCVVASNHLMPHLSHRRQLYLLVPLGYERVPPADCEYVVADLREWRWGDGRPAVAEFIQQRGYRTIFERDEVIVLAAPR